MASEFTLTIPFAASSNYEYDSTKIEFAASAAQLKAPYSLTNPTVKTKMLFLTNVIGSCVVTWATGTDTLNEVRFAVEVNGEEKYWDGISWVLSTGYSQTNTPAVLATNIASLVSATKRNYVRFVAYLHSNAGTSTPTLYNIQVVFNYTLTSAVNVCTVYGTLLDAEGDPFVGATVTARPLSSLLNGTSLIANDAIRTTTNASGYWSMDLIYSSGYSSSNQYEVVFESEDGVYRAIFIRTVPSEATKSFSDLVE